MLEELKEEAIIQKVGGRFRLSSLIQKRLLMMSGQSTPIGENTSDRIHFVIQEILQDKIWLDTDGNLRTHEDDAQANPIDLPSAQAPAVDSFQDMA